MLESRILKTDYGVSYGSVTLKSLQNDNIPELDLLVREAIQNSSDAALNQEEKYYVVNFGTGTFVPSRFNSFLTGIESVLNTRFPGEIADFLEIRDTKTSGLTGKIRKNEIKKDDHGNFFKLIYDTGKQQTNTLAGGNWGFGKSVYYRVGIGIVVFYSRVFEEGKYEDRLIITLVEHENKTDENGRDITLLNSVEPQSAGKAWWGIREGEDLLPLTDMELIQPVLDVFGVRPFKENETGTSIIIPYINTEELLSEVIPVEAELREGVKETFMASWATRLSDYLRLSIQKWYAPKIQNTNLKDFCKNKWLVASVDNVPIRKQDMLPFFRLTQELYTSALAKTYSYDDYSIREYAGIESFPVKIQSYLKNGLTSGYVSMVRITKSDLNSSLSPYDYIGKFETEGGKNDPIVMCARDPGMVIDYAITGPWVKGLQHSDNPEEYLFAFFVPATEQIIKDNPDFQDFAGMNLGAYLRLCEASDHMGWNDPAKMQIVQRIQRNTIKQINNKIKADTENTIDATASILSQRLGSKLLPRVDYGKKGEGGGGSGGGGGGGARIKDAVFNVISSALYGDELIVDFQLKFTQRKKKGILSLLIASEAGWINAKSWNEDIGTLFPVEIKECLINTVNASSLDRPRDISKACTTETKTIEDQDFSTSLEAETENGIITQLRFSLEIVNPEFIGKLRLRCSDKKYRFAFKIE